MRVGGEFGQPDPKAEPDRLVAGLLGLPMGCFFPRRGNKDPREEWADKTPPAAEAGFKMLIR